MCCRTTTITVKLVTSCKSIRAGQRTEPPNECSQPLRVPPTVKWNQHVEPVRMPVQNIQLISLISAASCDLCNQQIHADTKLNENRTSTLSPRSEETNHCAALLSLISESKENASSVLLDLFSSVEFVCTAAFKLRLSARQKTRGSGVLIKSLLFVFLCVSFLCYCSAVLTHVRVHLHRPAVTCSLCPNSAVRAGYRSSKLPQGADAFHGSDLECVCVCVCVCVYSTHTHAHTL